LLAVAAAIALANLSSEAVTGDHIKRIANGPERAYGWPLRWYWRIAETVPGSIKPQPGSAPRSLLQWPVARYSARNLIADLAIWLAVLTGAAAASRRLLRRYRPRLHWRPRMTTLVVLLAVAAPIVLANMSFEASLLAQPSWLQDGTLKAFFGWPLRWNWYFVAPFHDVYGWDFSAACLAGNVLVWLATLVLAASAWEWLLRRYPPRFRFSLRTMFAATALVSLLCAWSISVWKRADEQDAFVASTQSVNNYVGVQRWGPKWLGLVAPDRLRRRIVHARVYVGRSSKWAYEADQDADIAVEELKASDGQPLSADDEGLNADDEIAEMDRQDVELLRRLGRLSALRSLDIQCGLLTPAMADALADLAQIEQLSLAGVHGDNLGFLTGLTHLKSLTLDVKDCEYNELEMRKRLEAVGKLTQLRRLRLLGFPGAEIAQLGKLVKLKSLTLDFDRFFRGDEQRAHECFAALGKMTQIERLQIGRCEYLEIHPHDLACLGGLTNLKSLSLAISRTDMTRKELLAAIANLTKLRELRLEGDIVSAGLAELEPLESLEELSSDYGMANGAAIESLVELKHLKAVHIAGLDISLALTSEEAEHLRRALKSLRQAHPGIVVNGDSRPWDAPWLHWESMNDFTTDLDAFLQTTSAF